MRALRELFAPEDDDAPPAHRSRRDWIADSTLFVLAIALGALTLVSSSQHGLDGALLVIDAVGGALLCVALWWRRRWPLGLGFASLFVASSGVWNTTTFGGRMPVPKCSSVRAFAS